MEDQVEEPKRIYYRIGDVSKMLNSSPSAIRYWLKYFDVDTAKRSSRGRRNFNLKEVEILKQINHYIKEELYTLPGAKVKLDQWRKDQIESKSKMLSKFYNLKS